MNLLDQVRQTLGEAASNAREVGQNLGAQAQAQLQIKKLQLEHAKKLRDLGEKTYAWYQSGQMIVTGQVPADVRQLCSEIDESSTRLHLEKARLEDARQQASARANKDEAPTTFSVLPTPNSEDDMKTHKRDTQKLFADDEAANHGGVTMPGTHIVTNPTTNSDENHMSDTPETNAAPNATLPKTAGDDAPIVPVSDLAPSPSGEVAIGGGIVPGAPGTSDTLGGGISGGSMGGGFGGGTM